MDAKYLLHNLTGAHIDYYHVKDNLDKLWIELLKA